MYNNFAVGNAEEMDEEMRYLLSSSVYWAQDVALMPDAHKGKAHASVGFTSTYNCEIVPNTIGVDLNCRVSLYLLKGVKAGQLDLKAFDEVVNERVPSGFSLRGFESGWSSTFPYESLRCWDAIKDHEQRYRLSMGTLGGGNHMIELDRDRDDNLWLLIHSGSRNLGLQVANHYQKIAVQRKEKRIARAKLKRDEDIRVVKEQHLNFGRISEIRRQFDLYLDSEPEDELAYLTGTDMDNYLHDVDVIRKWSALNHQTVVDEIVRGLSSRGIKVEIGRRISSIHNYIDTEHKIVRKGAISARKGELGIIPLNMRDGVLVVEGKGNPEWNYSLPHGAGRVLSRRQAREQLSMDDYRRGMEGIYSTSIAESTLDEWAEAYKSADAVIAAIGDNARIVEHMLPVYNFKAK